MVCYENGKQKEMEYADLFEIDNKDKHIYVLSLDEFMSVNDKLNVKKRMLEEFHGHNNISAKIENHIEFYLIFLSIPLLLARKDNVKSLSVYFSKKMLLIVYIPWNSDDNLSQIISDNIARNESLGTNLISLLDIFTKEDSHTLQDIEKRITDLEDDLITSYNNEYIKNIITFRKDLLSLKCYYEQLVDFFGDFNENENLLLSDTELKHSGNITNRVNRLHQTVNNLRDYVTQVREAYQSQADINLNIIMKVFTVLAAFFLPLTLIAGWYGMNLKMPEYGFEYGYPVVILVCVVVVILCIILFKKNKWF